MYQLISALGKSKKVSARWESLEIGNIALSDLFGIYDQIYALLNNPLYPTKRTFDLNSVRSRLAGSSQTVEQYLASLGEEVITTTAVQYSVSTRYAHYSDAFRVHYKIEPISPLGHIDSSILMSDRDWLSLTRQDTDLDDFFRHCLVSVNGFIHQTDSDGQRIFVIDGMRSARLSGKNMVGITNFSQIGNLKLVKLQEEMVHRRYADVAYAKKMFIDLGEAYNGTPMLVLGGYLHVLDKNVFSRISERIFAIDFSHVPLRERYFESKDQIDLSSLGLHHTESNPSRIDDAELHNDAVLLKYATLSQSFIVFCDNDSLFVERDVLAPTFIAQTYTSYKEPVFPLVTGYGKFSEYWRVYEDGQWSVKICDGLKNNFEFNTTPESNLVCIDDARTPSEPADFSRAQYLIIGSDILVSSTV